MLALLSLSQFLVALDLTIVNIAMPSIGDELGFSAGGLQWTVSAYALTFGGFLLLGGRAADLFGRRRLLILGLGVFGAASLLAGLAANPGQLIAARALQGVGGALQTPAALALIATAFATGPRLDRAMSVWGAVSAAGAGCGVLLGGLLTASLGWRWVFFVNVPITLAAALVAPRLLDESRGEHRRGQPLDVGGAVTATVGLTTLVYAVAEGQIGGWGAPRTVAAFVTAAVFLSLFVVVERRAPAPLVRFGIFRRRSLLVANIVMLLAAPGILTMVYVASLYMQQVLHFSALQAGLAFLPQALVGVVMARVTGRLLPLMGLKPLLVCALLINAFSIFWLSRISADGTFTGDILWPTALFSVGGAPTIVTLTLASIAGAGHADTGLASGLINVSRQVGSALGVAVTASLATAHALSLAGDGPVTAADLTGGYRAGFVVGAASVVCGAVVAALFMPGGDRGTWGTRLRRADLDDGAAGR